MCVPSPVAIFVFVVSAMGHVQENARELDFEQGIVEAGHLVSQ
jgi:hypothetical protein